jgi:hypothetical protein
MSQAVGGSATTRPPVVSFSSVIGIILTITARS